MTSALQSADAGALAALLRDDPAAAVAPVGGQLPLLVLLMPLGGGPAGVKPGTLRCVQLLLNAGADPSSHTLSAFSSRTSALGLAISAGNVELARLLLERGAEVGEDEFGDAAVAAECCLTEEGIGCSHDHSDDPSRQIFEMVWYWPRST
jgi:hypothetical protein